jgi:hypothetical protein
VLRGHVRRAGWDSVGRGLHHSPEADPLLAWQLVLPPSGAFTGPTAAERYGWWLPPLPSQLPVFVGQATTDPRIRRPGVHVTRYSSPREHNDIDGVRLAVPGDVLLWSAHRMGLLDVVVLVDAALHMRTCTRQDLEQVSAHRRAGGPRLRKALELADERSESAWETLLRILHCVCKVAVEPQRVFFDEAGSFVGRADLWLVGTNAIHEYDGGGHLLRKQQDKDLRRGRRIVNSELVRRGYTSNDLLHRGVGILRDADLSLGRPHRPDRIRSWHQLLADSLFTPSGSARFLRRLGVKSGQFRQEPGAGTCRK